MRVTSGRKTGPLARGAGAGDGDGMPGVAVAVGGGGSDGSSVPPGGIGVDGTSTVGCAVTARRIYERRRSCWTGLVSNCGPCGLERRTELVAIQRWRHQWPSCAHRPGQLKQWQAELTHQCLQLERAAIKPHGIGTSNLEFNQRQIGPSMCNQALDELAISAGYLKVDLWIQIDITHTTPGRQIGLPAL